MLNARYKKIIFSLIFIVCIIFCFASDEEDNPWLYLKAIQESYNDIVEDFFFDSEANDWCIKIRGSYLYWASGRLLPKNHSSKWIKWNPFISYFYPENVPNPQDYPENFIEALKPKSLIKHRRYEPSPNYSFHHLVYQGKTKREIIKQLKKIKFFGIDIWIHKRVAEPLKRIEKKIILLQKNSPEVRLFVKSIGSCWGFNWRVIADSGKLSNHCWGTAVDILPKNYRNKKLYWFWEAVHNDNWMKVLPHKRWNPPDSVIKIFEDEGFIWGGKWTLWDNMHFEYRPELLYIRDFFLSQNPDKLTRPVKADKDNAVHKTEKTYGGTAAKKGSAASPIFDAVVNTAKLIMQLQYFIEETEYRYESAADYFKAELTEKHEDMEPPVPEYAEEMNE
ncbi:M15 family metallopeptidase [Treponema pedis]|uniref:M15 family metallopeptidase n=1 Tax=Treponema pedis TaxID=409322 RepID=A0A7S6WMV5_9SPIR|nr:M15 family metallopeptidase [Treponema pedis]QOW60073.1 M15 family metallopeptidase [Treponema pedis]